SGGAGSNLWRRLRAEEAGESGGRRRKGRVSFGAERVGVLLPGGMGQLARLGRYRHGEGISDAAIEAGGPDDEYDSRQRRVRLYVGLSAPEGDCSAVKR